MNLRYAAAGTALVIGGLLSGACGGSTSQGGGAAVRIGNPSAAGSFEFTVNSVTCGIPSVGQGNAAALATPNGQFCKVNIKVANRGQRAQALFSETQNAFDRSNRKFGVSVAAEVAANEVRGLFGFIKPGHLVEGNLYFELPVEDSIWKLEFHDNTPGSAGLTVLNR
jgi:hypothetical protein